MRTCVICDISIKQMVKKEKGDTYSWQGYGAKIVLTVFYSSELGY
jgi:hypothetical protein